MDTVEEEDVPNDPDEMLGGDKSELEHDVQLLFKDEELEVVKTPGDDSCLSYVFSMPCKSVPRSTPSNFVRWRQELLSPMLMSNSTGYRYVSGYLTRQR